MKTIIVLSDTHGYKRGIEKLDKIFAESDLIIHLGDTSADGNYIAAKYPDKTYVINGNCDLQKLGSDEEIIQVEDVKIFACHGHRYSVKTTLAKIAERAKNLGCKLALYGHTHIMREDEIVGITVVNPGSISRYGAQSYLYVVINADKIITKCVTTG